MEYTSQYIELFGVYIEVLLVWKHGQTTSLLGCDQDFMGKKNEAPSFEMGSDFCDMANYISFDYFLCKSTNIDI